MTPWLMSGAEMMNTMRIENTISIRTEVEIRDFVLAVAAGKVVVARRGRDSDHEAAHRGDQGHGDTRSDDGEVGGAVLANLEERNHDAPHRTQEAEERGKVRTRGQKAQVAVFGKAQTLDGALDSIFQERCAVLDGVVTHEVTELGGFLQHFGRQAAERTVFGRLAEALQLHELRDRAELAEEFGVCMLASAVSEELHDNDAPGTERHDGQDAQHDNRRDIGLKHHLYKRYGIIQRILLEKTLSAETTAPCTM